MYALLFPKPLVCHIEVNVDGVFLFIRNICFVNRGRLFALVIILNKYLFLVRYDIIEHFRNKLLS